MDKKCAQKFLINKLERGQIFTVKNGCAYEKPLHLDKNNFNKYSIQYMDLMYLLLLIFYVRCFFPYKQHGNCTEECQTECCHRR